MFKLFQQFLAGMFTCADATKRGNHTGVVRQNTNAGTSKEKQVASAISTLRSAHKGQESSNTNNEDDFQGVLREIGEESTTHRRIHRVNSLFLVAVGVAFSHTVHADFTEAHYSFDSCVQRTLSRVQYDDALFAILALEQSL